MQVNACGSLSGVLLDPTDTRDIEQSVPGRGQCWIIENSTGDEGGELPIYKIGQCGRGRNSENYFEL